MGCLKFIVLFITIALHRTSICEETPPSPDGPSTVPPNQDPVQEKCKAFPALKSSEDNRAYKVTEWIVTRVVMMNDPGTLDTTQNVCSVYSYVDGCKAIHHSTVVDKSSAKIQIVSTYAYFAPTDNLVHYTETFTKEDENFNVWSGKLDSMEYIAADGKTTKVDKIPEPVAKNHEKEFASVAVDKEGKWIIHRVCGSPESPDICIAWVSFPKEDLTKEKDPTPYLEKFNEDINKQLKDMNLDPATLIAIDTTLKIIPPDSTSPDSGGSIGPPPVAGTGGTLSLDSGLEPQHVFSSPVPPSTPSPPDSIPKASPGTQSIGSIPPAVSGTTPNHVFSSPESPPPTVP